MPFYCGVYDKLQDLGDYLSIVDKIRKSLKNRSKLMELFNEVKSAKQRFQTNEIIETEVLVNELI